MLHSLSSFHFSTISSVLAPPVRPRDVPASSPLQWLHFFFSFLWFSILSFLIITNTSCSLPPPTPSTYRRKFLFYTPVSQCFISHHLLPLSGSAILPLTPRRCQFEGGRNVKLWGSHNRGGGGDKLAVCSQSGVTPWWLIPDMSSRRCLFGWLWHGLLIMSHGHIIFLWSEQHSGISDKMLLW